VAKRVFLIVLDSFGIGHAPDAAEFGDRGANTLRSCIATGRLSVPHLCRMGLSHLPGAEGLPRVEAPMGAYGRLRELSRGKDTTVGHWELCGHVSPAPLPTYPEGFPPELIAEFSRRTGHEVVCNLPYSGTAVIEDYWQAQRERGALIVYTSADSVFQIAAHEEWIGLDELYRCCRIARELLTGAHGVGRVIARPYVGEPPHFTRTGNRHDYSLLPPAVLLPERLQRAGLDVIGVGKISDIFAGVGITESHPTSGNAEGQARLLELAGREFHGLCFVNLVDFDSKYGHRRDAVGYAEALSAFDETLGRLFPLLRPDDRLLITADHGCDPGYSGTDHTREMVPLLTAGGEMQGRMPDGVFADVARMVEEALGVDS